MKNLKINKKKVVALLLAFGISLSHSSFANANERNDRIIKVTGNHVNVRTEPTTVTKDNIIGQANKGDIFDVLDHKDEWYLIDYFGDYAYIYDQYGMEMLVNNEDIIDSNIEYGDIVVAKITGNNINVRSSADKKSSSNIIGFADMSDYFKIIDKIDDWYIIDYLGNVGYISSKYVTETSINEENLETIKMVCLKDDSILYSDTNQSYLSTLPRNQHLSVIKEENGYYKVRVDGVIGYVDPSDTRKLTNTFVVSDLGRQMIRVYKNNKEVYRAHMISGRKKLKTTTGVFKIGHKLTNYKLTKTNTVSYWMQYNGNEGLHDATWQKHSYFQEIANDAFDRYANGTCVTYPSKHGSHGCDNLELNDAKNIYNLVSVGDNVVVIRPNNLVNDGLVNYNNIYNSANCKPNQKIKKLV
jgi:uncharacterized protein YgiM (DUF1202 family)